MIKKKMHQQFIYCERLHFFSQCFAKEMTYVGLQYFIKMGNLYLKSWKCPHTQKCSLKLGNWPDSILEEEMSPENIIRLQRSYTGTLLCQQSFMCTKQLLMGLSKHMQCHCENWEKPTGGQMLRVPTCKWGSAFSKAVILARVHLWTVI